MLSLRPRPAESDSLANNTPNLYVNDLEQRIRHLNRTMDKKNARIHELETQLTTTEKSLDSEKQSKVEDRNKMKAFLTRLKQKYATKNEAHERDKIEFEKSQKLNLQLQQLATRNNAEITTLRESIKSFSTLARQQILSLRNEMRELRASALQTQQFHEGKLSRFSSKMIKVQTLQQTSITTLRRQLSDKRNKYKTLKSAARQTLNELNNQKQIIQDLNKQVAERQEKEGQLQQQLALALADAREKENQLHGSVDVYLENTLLKHQMQTLQDENRQHQELQRENRRKALQKLSFWKPWMLVGTAIALATTAELLLSVLGVASLLSNPLGWALLGLGAGISSYCFYQAKWNYTLTQALHSQESKPSSTAQTASALSLEAAGLRLLPEIQNAPNLANNNSPAVLIHAPIIPAVDEQARSQLNRRNI